MQLYFTAEVHKIVVELTNFFFPCGGDGGLRLCDRVHSDVQCSPCSKSPNGAKLPLVDSQSLCSYIHNIIYYIICVVCTLYIIYYMLCI